MIVLLHGAVGSKQQFKHLPLTAYTFDFEGHGNAPYRNRPFKMEHFVENLIEYLDTHAIEQADIFGYSMGGYVGLSAALLYPKRVRKVFTLATKFAWTPEIAAKEVAMLDAEKILAKVPRYAEALQHQHTDWQAVLAYTRELLVGLGEQPILTPETLAQITCPVRIGVGDHDIMVSLEAYRALKYGEFQVFPNTVHPFERVSVELIVRAMQEFFD